MASEGKGVEEGSECEAEVFERIKKYSTSFKDVSVDQVMSDLRVYGIQRLTGILNDGIRRQHQRVLSNVLFMHLYTACHTAVLHGDEIANSMWQQAAAEIVKYVTESILPALNVVSPALLPQEFRRRWADHKIFSTWMRKMFLFLDKQMSESLGGPNKLPLVVISFRKFKQHVFEVKKYDIARAVHDMINRERNGEAVDRELLKEVINCFVMMGAVEQFASEHAAKIKSNRGTYSNPDTLRVSTVAQLEKYVVDTQNQVSLTYVEDFEKPFLTATKAFYAAKSREWIDADSSSTYLKKAELALEAEGARVGAYLHPSTRAKLVKNVETELIAHNVKPLLQKERSGMLALLEARQLEDLERMHRLFKPVPEGILTMADLFTTFFKEKGEMLVARHRSEAEAEEKRSAPVVAVAKKKKRKKKRRTADPADMPAYVQELVDLHTDCRNLVTTQFKGDIVLENALKTVFEHIIAQEPSKAASNAEVLCTYCDKVLKGRRGKVKLTEQEVETALDAVVCLFRYHKDKDVFAENYRHFLAQRLLSGKTLNNAHERSMLTKLKMECGAQLTQKMEGMMSNMELGRENRNEYATAWKKQGYGFEFQPLVLQCGFWPSFFNLPQVNIPRPMQPAIEHFKTFYTNKHKHRSLTWILTQGRATLRCNLVNGRRDFDVTTLQAIALLYFNERESWPFMELCKTLGLAGDDASVHAAKRILHPLSCAKERDILVKTPKGKSIDEHDVFTFNASFKHVKRVLVMHAPVLEERRKRTREAVDEQRLHVIDAAIVRIMKSRRTLSHVELVSQTLSQIRLFRTEPRMVKKRIETLIERDYLKRAEGQRGVYDYVA